MSTPELASTLSVSSSSNILSSLPNKYWFPCIFIICTELAVPSVFRGDRPLSWSRINNIGRTETSIPALSCDDIKHSFATLDSWRQHGALAALASWLRVTGCLFFCVEGNLQICRTHCAAACLLFAFFFSYINSFLRSSFHILYTCQERQLWYVFTLEFPQSASWFMALRWGGITYSGPSSWFIPPIPIFRRG